MSVSRHRLEYTATSATVDLLPDGKSAVLHILTTEPDVDISIQMARDTISLLGNQIVFLLKREAGQSVLE
jgi:hypothetical protein